MKDRPSAHRNRLGEESSPYLRQHADNPVDWYPWGPEALERAAREDKPILLSIGYSACHWCHVMAHESFEDPATAALMNEHFVNIKVDREERPDLDRIYQTAHQILTQRGGGWPLTMFLAPADRHPFFGGTYFPDLPRYGMPAFREVLERVAEYYRSHRADIARQNSALLEVLGELVPRPAAPDTTPDLTPLEEARQALARDFDSSYGGFGGAPKFPHATNLSLLLRLWRRTAQGDQPDLHSLYMATLTLTRMAEGGIYDQLAGGFCRYSVDPHWMIPHFEKMLYDNGQLLRVYAEAAVATGDAFYGRIAGETADWALSEMRAPEGGFFSALDADSEGHEGRFYVWTPDSVRAALEPELYEVFAPRFGLDRPANFEGEWHLHAYRPVEEVAQALGLPADETHRHLEIARRRLLALRNQRVRPGRDEKVLTAWNGLMIGGLAAAARALDRDDLTDAATRAVDFIRLQLLRDGRLLAAFKDGRSRFPAYLDDHAFLLDALLGLLETRWRSADLEFALVLAESLLEHFEDRQDGGFFFTADDQEALIHRPKSYADEAMPSGNGVAAQSLIRLGQLFGESRYLDAAGRALRAAWPALRRFPHAHASLLIALEEYLEPPTIVIIRGAAEQASIWRRELDRVYAPHRMVLAIPSDANGLPDAIASKAAGRETIAYVCRGPVCSEPVRSLAALVALTRA